MPQARCPVCETVCDVPAAHQTLLDCAHCRARFLPPECTALPLLIDGAATVEIPLTLSPAFSRRYRLGQLLGSGASGSVYAATDRKTHAPVAIKFLLRLQDKTSLSRFIQEGRLLERIQHPHVLRLLDVGELAGHPYLVTELVTGGSLSQLLKARKRLAQPQAFALILEVLEGLHACHLAGVVHRDLKPENILLDEHGQARVADLGIAKDYTAVDVNATVVGTLLGTPRYMSPEQARGESAVIGSDIYSAAVVLYELLTGRPVFSADSALICLEMHRRVTPRPAAELDPSIPAAVSALIQRCLSKHATERPASAKEFALALRRIVTPAIREPEPMSLVESTPELMAMPQPRRQNLSTWIVGALLITVAMLAPRSAFEHLGSNSSKPVAPPAGARSAGTLPPAAGLASQVERKPATIAGSVKISDYVGLMRQGREKATGGYYREAAACFLKASRSAKIDESLEASIALASAQQDNGDENEAWDTAFAALEVCNRELTATDSEKALVHLQCARALYRREHLGDASTHVQIAADLIKYTAPGDGSIRAQVLTQRAQLEMKARQFVEARADTEEALKIYRQNAGVSPALLSNCLCQKAEIDTAQWEMRAAANAFRDALGVVAAHLRPHHPAQLRPMTELIAEAARGQRYAEADRLSREAWYIVSSNNVTTEGRFQLELAELNRFHYQKKYSLALKHGENARILLDRAPTFLRRLRPEFLTHTAIVFNTMGNYKRGESYAAEAVMLGTSLWGPEDLGVLYPQILLGTLMRRQGKYTAALALFDKSIAALKTYDPAYRWLLGDVYRRKADLLSLTRRFSAAERDYAQALKLLDRLPPPTPPGLLDCAHWLVQYYTETDHPKLAAELCNRYGIRPPLHPVRSRPEVAGEFDF